MAIVLHWSIAVLIIANVAMGLGAQWIPDGWVRPVIDTHKSVGITVLGLAILRVLWRLTHRPPPLLAHTDPAGAWDRIEHAAAHVTHLLLYFLIFLLPLSGWAHDSAWKDAATHPMYLFGLFEWPRIGWVTGLDAALKETLHDRFGSLHTWLGYCLYALLALHIAGALKHEWIDRQSVIRRMLP
jgi:cytochrome b561